MHYKTLTPRRPLIYPSPFLLYDRAPVSSFRSPLRSSVRPPLVLIQLLAWMITGSWADENGVLKTKRRRNFERTVDSFGLIVRLILWMIVFHPSSYIYIDVYYSVIAFPSYTFHFLIPVWNTNFPKFLHDDLFFIHRVIETAGKKKRKKKK